MDNKELTVKIGGVADLISAIEKAKFQLKEDVDKLYNDKSRTQPANKKSRLK